MYKPSNLVVKLTNQEYLEKLYFSDLAKQTRYGPELIFQKYPYLPISLNFDSDKDIKED